MTKDEGYEAICHMMREYIDTLATMRTQGIIDERFDKLCQEFIEWGKWVQPRLEELDAELTRQGNKKIVRNNQKIAGNKQKVKESQGKILELKERN